MDISSIQSLMHNLTPGEAKELRESMIERSCAEATIQIRSKLYSCLTDLTDRYPDRIFHFNGKFFAHEPLKQQEEE